MLAVKSSAGVTTEVNVRILLHAGDDSVFETRDNHHQEFKIGLSVAPQKRLLSSKNSYRSKKNYFTDCSGLTSSEGQRWKEHRRFVHTALKDFGMGREILEPKIHEEIQVLCPLTQKHFALLHQFSLIRVICASKPCKQ